MFAVITTWIMEEKQLAIDSSIYICVCYHQNHTLHKDRVNNFPVFDDDKPNDHIDMKDKIKLVPTSQTTVEKIFKKSA